MFQRHDATTVNDQLSRLVRFLEILHVATLDDWNYRQGSYSTVDIYTTWIHKDCGGGVYHYWFSALCCALQNAINEQIWTGVTCILMYTERGGSIVTSWTEGVWWLWTETIAHWVYDQARTEGQLVYCTNNNITTTQGSMCAAVIMTRWLQELTQFIWWM